MAGAHLLVWLPPMGILIVCSKMKLAALIAATVAVCNCAVCIYHKTTGKNASKHIASSVCYITRSHKCSSELHQEIFMILRSLSTE